MYICKSYSRKTIHSTEFAKILLRYMMEMDMRSGITGAWANTKWKIYKRTPGMNSLLFFFAKTLSTNTKWALDHDDISHVEFQMNIWHGFLFLPSVLQPSGGIWSPQLPHSIYKKTSRRYDKMREMNANKINVNIPA